MDKENAVQKHSVCHSVIKKIQNYAIFMNMHITRNDHIKQNSPDLQRSKAPISLKLKMLAVLGKNDFNIEEGPF